MSGNKSHTFASDAPNSPPRAQGSVRAGVIFKEGRSRLADFRVSGSLKTLFPRPVSNALDAVLLNTAGGITGGDDFDISIEVGPNAEAIFTTQAAERIYRAPEGTTGCVRTTLDLRDRGSIVWLPQETILFDGAALDRSLQVALTSSSSALMCETLLFGRTAMGEVVRDIRLKDRIDIRVDGALVFADRLSLSGNADRILERFGVSNGGLAVASVVWHAPHAAARLPDLQVDLDMLTGGSALTNDLIFFRIVAPDGFAMRKKMIPLLRAIARTDIPKTWTL